MYDAFPQQLQTIFKSAIRAGSLHKMRAATPLPKRAEELIDKAVIRIGRQRLTFVADLLAEGLTMNIPNWLAVPTLTSHKLGEAGAAKRGMVPKKKSVLDERQIMNWTPYTLPLYVTWDGFEFDARELAAAEQAGNPLDTVHVEQAIRNVNEAIEDAGINGGPQIGGNTTPGALSTTNTFAYDGGEAWDAAGHTGEEILNDVQGGVDVLQADKFYGPYNLYVPTTYGTKLNEDFKSNSDKTILQRLQELQYGGRNLRVRVADMLPTNRTLLVQMTSDVVDVIVGQQPVPVAVPDPTGWSTEWVVLACIVPRVKNNSDSNYGIAAGNLT